MIERPLNQREDLLVAPAVERQPERDHQQQRAPGVPAPFGQRAQPRPLALQLGGEPRIPHPAGGPVGLEPRDNPWLGFSKLLDHHPQQLARVSEPAGTYGRSSEQQRDRAARPRILGSVQRLREMVGRGRVASQQLGGSERMQHSGPLAGRRRLS